MTIGFVRVIQSRQIIITYFLVILFTPTVYADVVKPALVEISVYKDQRVEIEIRTSIEALLTGINAQYKNTLEAPNANDYDRYREMTSVELLEAFKSFHATLLDSVVLTVDGSPIPLKISEVYAAPTGYTKVPRVSVITLLGRLPADVIHLRWYYPAVFGEQAVRVRQVNSSIGEYHWSPYQWIRHDRPTNPFLITKIFGRPSFTTVMKSYVYGGVLHIFPMGFDHILFVLSLFFATTRLKSLAWQVTLFTIAHSVTLILGVLDLVSVPAIIVEPFIALSITYISFEQIFRDKLSRLKLPIVFAFGLLHGLGFASMLRQFGIPEDSFISALIWFNIGIELGQISVLISAFFIFRIWFKSDYLYHIWIRIPASIVIGFTGFYLFIERLDFGQF